MFVSGMGGNNFCSILIQRQRFTDDLYIVYITTCIVNVIFSVLTITGNGFVILAILRKSSLHTPSYLLLSTLIVSDLGVGLIVQPLYVAFRVTGILKMQDAHCTLGLVYNYITIFLMWLSFVTITAISADRFLALFLHMRYRAVVTMERVKIVVFILWFVAGLVDVAFTFSVAAYWVTINVILSVCLLITSFNYLNINRIIRQHALQVRIHFSRNAAVTIQPSTNAFDIVRYKKTVKGMLYVYCAFLLCYVPYFCLAFAVNAVGRNTFIHGANQVLVTLVFINSALNAVLYYLRVPQIRGAVRRMIRRSEVGTTGQHKSRYRTQNACN